MVVQPKSTCENSYMILETTNVWLLPCCTSVMRRPYYSIKEMAEGLSNEFIIHEYVGEHKGPVTAQSCLPEYFIQFMKVTILKN